MSAQAKLWNKDFVLVIVTNFLLFMNHLMILSTFPFYVDRLGGNEALAGLAAASFSIMAVILRPIIGWMLNNGVRKKLLLIGLILMGLMPIGYMLVSVFFLAFLFRTVHGAGLSLANTSMATVATDLVPKARFAEGMGMFGMATALATAAGPALGLALMNKAGYSVLFIFSAAAIGIAIVLLFLVDAPDIEVEPQPFELRTLLDKNALPASITAMIFLFSYAAFENFTAKFADTFGLPSGGYFFAISAAVVFLTRMLVGKQTDRHGEEIFVYICNVSMLVALLLLGLIPCVATYFTAAVFVGFGFGGFEPALQAMAVAIAPPERRGSANSTFLCAYDIGLGLGGGVSGFLINGVGYQKMFLCMIVFNVLSVIVYILIGRNHPSSFRFHKTLH